MKFIEKRFEHNNNLETKDSNYRTDKDDWNYFIRPEEIKQYNNRELYTVDKNGKYWMGKYGREKIENKNSDDSTYIGYREDKDGLDDISIQYNLSGNIALFGQTGYGKTTLMNNMMLQWINRGYGLCYIVPKGDDGKEFIRKIPSNRIDDTVYINIGSKNEARLMVNLFKPTRSEDDEGYEQEVETLTNAFVRMLKDRSDKWSNRTEYILETVGYELIRDKDKYLLDGLLPIIGDKREMQRFVKNKENIENTFIKTLSSINNSERNAIRNIVNNIKNNRPINQLIKKGNTSLDIGELVRESKILIIDGSSFYSRLNRESALQLILSKISTNAKQSKDPFYLCMDEIDLFTTRNFDIDELIKRDRNSNLRVLASAQQPSQLPNDIRKHIENFSTIFTFNPGQNPRDQEEISQLFGCDTENQDISKMKIFKAFGIVNNKEEPILINTPGEYPPLRSFKDSVEKMDLDKHKILPG